MAKREVRAEAGWRWAKGVGKWEIYNSVNNKNREKNIFKNYCNINQRKMKKYTTFEF